jgi:hypothetical protein
MVVDKGKIEIAKMYVFVFVLFVLIQTTSNLSDFLLQILSTLHLPIQNLTTNSKPPTTKSLISSNTLLTYDDTAISITITN